MPFTGSFTVPDYGASSYGVANTHSGTPGGVPNTATRRADYAGATAAIAGAVISGFFESRNQAMQDASAARRQEASARYQSYMQDVDQYHARQDRRFVEEGIGGYRGMYSGAQPLMTPEYTNPGTRPVDPYTRPRG